MLWLVLLSLLVFAFNAQAGSVPCDVLIGESSSLDVELYGPDVSFCPSYQLAYGTAVNTANFSVVHAVSTSSLTDRTVSTVLVSSLSLNSSFLFFENPAASKYLNGLSVSIELFSFDALTCTETIQDTATCSIAYLLEIPVSCSYACGGPSCLVASVNCEPIDTTSPASDPLFFRINAGSSVPYVPMDPNGYFFMSEFSMASGGPILSATTFPNGCVAGTQVDNFFTEFGYIGCPLSGETQSQSQSVSQSASSSMSQSPDFCPNITSVVRPSQRSDLFRNPFEMSCPFNLVASSVLTNNSFIELLIPLDEVTPLTYLPIINITMIIGVVSDTAPDLFLGFTPDCDTVLNNLSIDHTGPDFSGFCNQTMQSFNSYVYSGSVVIQTIADSPVLSLRFLSYSNPSPLYVGTITLTLFDPNDGYIEYDLNTDICFSDVRIPPLQCSCGPSCNDLQNDYDYALGPVSPRYYAAPFIVDTGGFSTSGPFKRRAEVSVNETDSAMSFLFSKYQFLHENIGSFPNAYVAAINISNSLNCGVNVHVLPCSGNLQVWLHAKPSYSFQEPSPFSGDVELFRCYAVTSETYGTPVALTPDIFVVTEYIEDTLPPQYVTVLSMFTRLEVNQTGINLDRFYAFEIQRPPAVSPATGLFFRCELGSDLDFGSIIEDTYEPLFPDSNYCQSSEISGASVAGVVPMPIFNDPIRSPILLGPFDSNFRYMSFMAASYCNAFDMCPFNGISFYQPHVYAPDYVGPMFAFPFQMYGPVSTATGDYGMTVQFELEKIIDAIVGSDPRPSFPILESFVRVDFQYALEFDLTGVITNKVTITRADNCTQYTCGQDVIDTFVVYQQADILQGFETYLLGDSFPANHRSFSSDITLCLRNYAEDMQFTGDVSELIFTSSLQVIATDNVSNTNILSRVLVHGAEFTFEAFDSQTNLSSFISGKFLPKNCTTPLATTCQSCNGTSEQITSLYRNTVANNTNECRTSPIISPILLQPEVNHYQPFIGVQIPLNAIPGLQPVNIIDPSRTIQEQLYYNKLIQVIQITFVAPFAWAIRQASLAFTAYVTYCDVMHRDAFVFDNILIGQPWPCTDLIDDPYVFTIQIQMLEYNFPEGFIGTYAETGDTSLAILFPDIRPGEKIIVSEVNVKVQSIEKCNANDSEPWNVYNCLGTDYNFAFTSQNCSVLSPGDCGCQGCSKTGVPFGTPGSGTSYLVSPLIITPNVSTPINDIHPPTYNTARRIDIEESDPFLNEYFNVSASISAYAGVMTAPNSDGLLGETIVIDDNCGVYVHIKNCTSNFQVWVNPAPTVELVVEQYRRRGSRYFFYCTVLSDINLPISVIKLTDNMEFDYRAIDEQDLPTVVPPLPPFLLPLTQQVVVIGMNADSNITGNIETLTSFGPYGFEIQRPYGEGYSGLYVFCDMYAAPETSFDVQVPGAVEPLFAGKNFCETGKPPTPVAQFSETVTVDTLVYSNKYLVPSFNIFGTPDCPSVPMCPENQWFFNRPYQFTTDYLGGMYAIPGNPLSNIGPSSPFSQQAIFRLSDPAFVELYESRSPNQLLSMTIILAFGERQLGANLDTRLRFEDSFCGIEACHVNTERGELSDIPPALQTAVLGVGIASGNTAYRDYIVFLVQFGPECFNRLQTLQDYEKYSIVLNINATSTTPTPDYRSTIFQNVMLGPIRFFLNETNNDVNGITKPYLFKNVLYSPDGTCKRKPRNLAFVCDDECHTSQLDPEIFPSRNNISLITPHPNSTQDSYADVTGVPGIVFTDIMVNALTNISDYSSLMEIAESNLYSSLIALGAEFVGTSTFFDDGNDVWRTLYTLCQFDAEISRQFLLIRDETLVFPFVPGGYIQYTETEASIFAFGVCAAFPAINNTLIDFVSPAYVFISGSYHDCSYDPASLSCTGTVYSPLISSVVPNNYTTVVIPVATLTPGLVLDPYSDAFLSNSDTTAFTVNLTADFLPEYQATADNQTFIIAPNFQGAPPGNLTGTGYLSGDLFVREGDKNSTVMGVGNYRWRFIASPCANESYFPFPYSQTPTASQTFTRTKSESESPTRSESPTPSEFTFTRSPSRTESLEPVLEMCCVRNELLSPIVLSRVCPITPIYGCSFLDLPPKLLSGGVYQVRDHYFTINQTFSPNPIVLRTGIQLGGIWLTFTEPNTNVKFYYLPGSNKVVLKGTAYGRISNGVFGIQTTNDPNSCVAPPFPSVFPGLFNFSIEMDTALIPIYGEPAADFAFLVSERTATPPHQRIPVELSRVNVGYLYPSSYPAANITFGLSDLGSATGLLVGVNNIVESYTPIQFGVALNLPGTHTGTYTGIGGLAYNCSQFLGQSTDPIVNFTRHMACFNNTNTVGIAKGVFSFDIEAQCNDCEPTPTPGLCPIHGVTHSQSQSHITQSASQSPTQYSLDYKPYNQTCYTNLGFIPPRCMVLGPSVIAPDIWNDTTITYVSEKNPVNSPFPDFNFNVVVFNASLIGSGQRFTKFALPNWPGRTSVYITIYLWSSVMIEDDYTSEDYEYDPYNSPPWNPSERGAYAIPPNMVVIVGAGESPRIECPRSRNIARCEINFPAYGGYVYMGIGTQPRRNLTHDVGFAYVEMLLINGLGFDDTIAPNQPIVALPNCVMVNVSIGTPNDPACPLGWGDSAPTGGSNAYGEFLATSINGILVMGGVSAAGVLMCFQYKRDIGDFQERLIKPKKSNNNTHDPENLPQRGANVNYVEQITSEGKDDDGESGLQNAELHSVIDVDEEADT